MQWRTCAAALVLLTMFDTAALSADTRTHHHARRRKLVHAAGWAGAGAAAGHLAGPAGSAAVGAAKYRHDLAGNGRTRRRAMVKIGAPIAAGAMAGPAGTVGYEAYDHRHWIKRHLTGNHHHHQRAERERSGHRGA